MPKILLVDDNANVLDGLRRVLEREDFEVLTAQSVNEGLQVIKKSLPDVIIADEHMPGCSGTEFLIRLRSTHPDIIRMMLTGEADLKTAVRAINKGEIYRFFLKPANHQEIIMAVREALQQQKLLRETRKLVDGLKQKTSTLEFVERENPGITHVQRDMTGAHLILDTGIDLQETLKRVSEELELAEARFNGK